MTIKEIHDYILSFPNTWLDFPFGEGTSVYKIGHEKTGGGKMFVLIADNSKPLRLSLKCDPLLAENLRETYETVLPGFHLNKRHWNTVILTGQIPWEEVRGMIHHSYDLVSGNKNAIPDVG